MNFALRRLPAWIGFLLLASSTQAAETTPEAPAWVAAMREIHSAQPGEPGVLLNMGDSITYSMAYFAPLQYARDDQVPSEMRPALRTVNRKMKAECYRWKGADKGNDGGKTAAWALEHVDRWIDTLHPEAAVIMFGTNDIRGGTVEEHEKNLRALVRRCMARGVIPILTTIPPMHGYDEQVLQAVEAQREIARDLNVPLIDFYAHVMNRRPEDWDGTLPQFSSFDQWQVPTIISKDGVHLSNPEAWQQDYTEQGRSRNGNVLRNFLTVMAYAEIIDVVIDGNSPGEISSTVLGANPPAPNPN